MAMRTRNLLLAVVIAATSLVTTGYNVYPQGRFSDWVIKDNTITVCYGTAQDDGIYVNRSRIAEELELTWGSFMRFGSGGPIQFLSNGQCDNDGSNVKIIWNRSFLNCTGLAPNWYGKADPKNWEFYDQITIQLNAYCNISGKMDWTLSDGINSNQFSARRLIAHEFGHALGLNHGNPEALMADGNDDTCAWFGRHKRDWTDDYRGMYDEYDTVAGFNFYDYYTPIGKTHDCGWAA
jgi:hypothetical protein